MKQAQLPFANDDRGRLPSKNPLSPENIVRVVDSGLSIHSGNPSIGRTETIQNRQP